MYMKIFLISILTVVQNCSNDSISIYGKWVNIDDKQSVVLFDKNLLYRINGLDTISISNYIRSSNSCDLKYLNSNDPTLDFIKLEDGTCFEITGLSDSTLTYRHTVSGKIHMYCRESDR